MARTSRPLTALALAAAGALALGACETSSFSSDCDSDGTCSISISGTDFHEATLSFAAEDQGSGRTERIRLVEATPGGDAVIQAGGMESRCREGESFVLADTTVTCDVVGDTEVELSTVRS